MENLLKINNETFVKVQTEYNDLFTNIYYVNRKDKEGLWTKGIAFLNYEDAKKYEKTLNKVLKLNTFISTEAIYLKL